MTSSGKGQKWTSFNRRNDCSLVRIGILVHTFFAPKAHTHVSMVDQQGTMADSQARKG